MIKKALLTILTILVILPLHAQQAQDTAFIFRFQNGSDAFYMSYGNNDKELPHLMDVLEQHREALKNGTVYINISSYGAVGNEKNTAAQIAYLRNSRVKSELITRHRITEQMFLTDKHIEHPYGSEGLRNVVVVTFPASLEKIKQIAGKETADKIRAYSKGQTEKQAAQEEPVREIPQKAEPAGASETHTQPAPEEPVPPMDEPTGHSVQAQPEVTPSFAKLSLRANLLRWATLTPDLGIEWRINKHWSMLVHGSWTSWSWDNKNRRYALWEVSPEVRYHLGTKKQGYVGAMYHAGQFNYKLSDTGKQGDLMGGGITGGYQLRLNRALALDFSIGIGCTHAEYDKYAVIDGIRVKQDKGNKNYWGINHAGITLVWQLK